VVIVLLAMWAYVFDPIVAGYTLPCPWYEFTGLLCPGCGLQRATHALLHGDFRSAFEANPLVFLLLPLTVAVIVTWYVERCFDVPAARFRMPVWVVILLIVVVLLFWVLRNVSA